MSVHFHKRMIFVPCGILWGNILKPRAQTPCPKALGSLHADTSWAEPYALNPIPNPQTQQTPQSPRQNLKILHQTPGKTLNLNPKPFLHVDSELQTPRRKDIALHPGPMLKSSPSSSSGCCCAARFLSCWDHLSVAVTLFPDPWEDLESRCSLINGS